MKSAFRPLIVLVAALLAVMPFLASCRKNSENQAARKRIVPVTAGEIVKKTLPVQVSAIGTVEELARVEVRSQVGGVLKEVYFTEGQFVRQGAPLFLIDPGPYEASLEKVEGSRSKDRSTVLQARASYERTLKEEPQARANYEKALAQVSQAEAVLKKDTVQAQNAAVLEKRYADLIEKGFTTQADYDQYRTNAEALKATVESDRASLANAKAGVRAARADFERAVANSRATRETIGQAQGALAMSTADVKSARIDLGFCSITSPIEGRTGSYNIDRGNVIKANDTNPLVVINKVRPIYVSFTVPEKWLPEIKKYSDLGTLKVEAATREEGKKGEKGKLVFIDNAVDTTTGTIRLKGLFQNRDLSLWPGQFVDVSLTLTVHPDVTVAPRDAVQSGQKGDYVFIVKEGGTVDLRIVKTGLTVGEETEILEGVSPGEKIVTDGFQKLAPGTAVEIKNPEKPPGSRGGLKE
ncbi:MAG: efflux RND transporter periplasmic adaptor subunit [Candidatus Eremiobacteraeota bacterium]|nr:efflux RND transporter periplasmic adaptor subunit [Candidatus Eremiobacteraeota bacterium]